MEVTCAEKAWDEVQQVADVLDNRSPGGPCFVGRHIRKAHNLIRDHAGDTEEGPLFRAWLHSVYDVITAGSTLQLRRLVCIARQKAKKIEVRSQKQGLKDWRQWVTSAPSSPSADGVGRPKAPNKNAYRWVRGMGGWTQSPVGPIDFDDLAGQQPDDSPDDFLQACHQDAPTLLQIWQPGLSGDDIPLCDQGDVEAEANQWAGLWEELQQYEDPFEGIELEDKGPLEVFSLRQSAMSFPIGTGIGCDNISPRAVGRLSDAALFALALLLHACERRGRWGSLICLVVIVLLPKPDGGRRPIGLFPALVRIWMRARVDLARRWEQQHHRSGIFGGAEMGA